MSARCCRIIVASMALLPAIRSVTAAADDSFPVLTVCEALSEPGRYDGKQVVIVGRSSGTSEGSWLSEDCGLKVMNGGREFEPGISTTYVASQFEPPPALPFNFKWDRRQLNRKLEEVRRTTRLKDPHDRWAAEFGRLETKLPRNIRKVGDHISYVTGFGHQSAAPAQLIEPKHGFLQLHAK